MKDDAVKGEINVTSVTVQAALFSLLSTTIAQLITAWRSQSATFAASPYITFTILAILTTPPNFIYQEWLEKTFPTYIADAKQDNKSATRFSVNNALNKLLLDQTVGASVNTVAFIILSALIQGNSLAQGLSDVQEGFWQLISAGWRIWPFVTLVNLCLVPWDWRPVVGNTAGVCWNIYLTMMRI